MQERIHPDPDRILQVAQTTAGGPMRPQHPFLPPAAPGHSEDDQNAGRPAAVPGPVGGMTASALQDLRRNLARALPRTNRVAPGAALLDAPEAAAAAARIYDVSTLLHSSQHSDASTAQDRRRPGSRVHPAFSSADSADVSLVRIVPVRDVINPPRSPTPSVTYEPPIARGKAGHSSVMTGHPLEARPKTATARSVTVVHVPEGTGAAGARPDRLAQHRLRKNVVAPGWVDRLSQPASSSSSSH